MDRLFLRKTSLVDYPSKVAAVLFFAGCNLRCPWCQNRELVLPDLLVGRTDLLSIDEVECYLVKRRSVLGGVVLSGGEPTLRADLGRIVKRLKALGFPVKLDTNGMNPGLLEGLFSQEETRPDYIALDLKLPPKRYGELSVRGLSEGSVDTQGEAGEALKESAALIRSSGIAHEFRSLALPEAYLKPEEICAMAAMVDDAPWYFRVFRAGNCLNPLWNTLEAPDPKAAAALARKACEAGKRGIGA